MPLTAIDASQHLSAAACFLRENGLCVKACYKRNGPATELRETRTSTPFPLSRCPSKALAELHGAEMRSLAAKAIDAAALRTCGFCSFDAADPRFLFNRLAPVSVDIESASSEVAEGSRHFFRLVRVKRSSPAWSRLRHRGTRIDVTNALSRAVTRLTGCDTIFLQYIAPYEPFLASGPRTKPRHDPANDVVLEHCTLFAGDSSRVVPKGEDAYVVLIDNSSPPPAVWDAVEEVVRNCLSARLPEDVSEDPRTHYVKLNAAHELPAAVDALRVGPTTELLHVSAPGEARAPWTAPAQALPPSLNFVSLTEVDHLEPEALLWFLRQDTLAAVAARVRPVGVVGLVRAGAEAASLARLAWLSPARLRSSKWRGDLVAAFENGEGGEVCVCGGGG